MRSKVIGCPLWTALALLVLLVASVSCNKWFSESKNQDENQNRNQDLQQHHHSHSGQPGSVCAGMNSASCRYCCRKYNMYARPALSMSGSNWSVGGCECASK